MVQAPVDASSVMGGVDTEGLQDVQELARGRYSEGVKEAMPRDYVTMYHPDGTTSIVQLPIIGKTNRAKRVQERQQKIMHYMVNKRRNGQQWWFSSPPPGWAPSPLPYRCPVEGCERAAGCATS